MVPARTGATALAGLTALTVAGCSSGPGPVAIGAPLTTGAVSAEVAAECAELVAALPDEVDPGVERREVTGGSERFAAWGDPAVVLECGVVRPDREEPPAIVNGVAWTVRDVGAGFRWTTRDLVVNLAVDVPDAYPNGAELVNPLAAPITGTLELAPDAPPPGSAVPGAPLPSPS